MDNNAPATWADGDALQGLYLEGAAFKAKIIRCLAAGGFAVHSVRHTGEFHVIQVCTPPYLRDPGAFARWEKEQKKADGVPPEPTPDTPAPGASE